MNMFARHRPEPRNAPAPTTHDKTSWDTAASRLDRSRLPAISVIALLFIGAVVIGALIVMAAREQDRLATEESIRLAGNVITARQAELGRLVRDYAYWDDALQNLDLEPSAAWAAENIGAYMAEAFGVSSSLVLGAENTPVLSFTAGEQSVLADLSGYEGGLQRLAAEARLMSLEALTASTGILGIDGKVHIVAVAPISTAEAADWPADRAIQSRSVLVLTQAIDEEFLRPLGEQFGLANLSIGESGDTPGRSSLALLSPDGGTIAYLTWSNKTPGIAMIRALAVPALLAFGVMAVLALWIIWHIDSARRITQANLETIGSKNRELIIARDQAELANRTKSEFLTNVSHELRTPLNAILGFSEVIRDQTFGPVGTPVYREYAQDIHQSGTLLLDLITDILDMSKIEAGKFELREERVDPAELSNSVMRMIRDRAEAAGLTVEFEPATNLPELRADPRALKQVLLNLLSNAVKFTPNGGKIVLRVARAPDNSIVFSVRDTGIGIAAEDLPQAMALFGQIDGALSRKHAGTGLGLPLSRALVELHGGRLDLTSEPGVGTTVIVQFPPERIAA
jgi:signal transduction histidine kinase